MTVLRALILLIAAATAACAGRPATGSAQAIAPSPEAPLVLSIVATTDLHGHVEALPWLAGHVSALRDARAKDGGGVVLVDAGDMFQGTLESNLGEGAPVVRAYNALGYNGAAIGNHEFDYGPEGRSSIPQSPGDNPRGALEARAREARFPLLAANVRASGGTAWSPKNIRPSAMVEVAGVKVGLIGVTTVGTAQATDPRNLVGLEIAPLAAAVTAEANALRSSGAAVVVVLAHAGAACKQLDAPDDITSCSPKQEIFDVARALPAGLVDAMAAGHTHQGVAHRVNGIAIVGAFAEGLAFGRIDLTLERTSHRVTNSRIFPPRFVCDGESPQPVRAIDAGACRPTPYEGRPVAFDHGMARLLAPDAAKATEIRDERLGPVLETPFDRRGRNESPVGNLVVDLMRAARPRADVALYNWGGLRADIPAGPVTYGRIHDVVPFDNALASIVMTAADFGRAIARSLEAGTLPSVSGLRGSARCGPSGPIVTWQRLDGRAVPPETRITIVTSGFLTAGGDGLFGGLPGERTTEPEILRDVVADALRARGGVLRADDPAIFDPDRLRITIPGSLPMRCTATDDTARPQG